MDYDVIKIGLQRYYIFLNCTNVLQKKFILLNPTLQLKINRFIFSALYCIKKNGRE